MDTMIEKLNGSFESHHSGSYSPNDEIERSWIRDTDDTWLENWWKSVGSGDLTVKSRLSRKKRTFADKSKQSHATLSEITYIDLFQLAQEEQIASDYYDVSLNGPNGLGLVMNVSLTGRAVVQSLSRMSNGQPSPAIASGIIKKGDVLIGINGADIEKMDLVDITAMLKLLEKTGKFDSVRLRFRYGDVIQNNERNSIVNKANSTNNSVSNRDRLSQFMEDPLLGISGDNTPVGSNGFGSSRFTGRELAISGDSVAAAGIFKDQVVDMLLNSDMYGTGVGSQLQLPSTNPIFSRPLVVTAEMLHSRLRSRHMYPTAARVSCNGANINELVLLRDLADEIFEWRPSYYGQVFCGYFADKRFSKFIRTPRDKARYKYTQQWDLNSQQYVTIDEEFLINQKFENQRNWLLLCDIIRSFKRQLTIVEAELVDQIEIKMLNDESAVLSMFVGGSESLSDSDSSDSDGEAIALRKRRESSMSAEENVGIDEYISSYAMNNQSSNNECNVRSQSKTSKRISATHSKAAVLHSTPESIAMMQSVAPATLSKLSNTRHVITSQHDEIRNMLRSEPDAIIAKLLLSLESDYRDYKQHTALQANRKSNQSNKFDIGPIPKHYETGIEVYLPPYDVTYLIFYAFLYKLTPVLLINPNIRVVLTKWMELFSPDSILQTKQTHSAVRSAPTSTTVAYTKYDFLMYYNNNLSTVTNIKGYLEVISDLVTLYFILNTGKSHLKIDNDNKINSVKPRESQSSKKVVQYCKMFYLPIVVEFTEFSNSSSKDVDEWNDKKASEFINIYRELVQMDIAAAVCSARQYFLSVEYLLAITTSNESFVDASVLLKELISRTCNNNQLNYNPVSSAQYIVDRVQSSVHSEFNLLFCLYLRHLGHLFRVNEQLAVELSLLFYPWSTPWVVRYFIFGEAHHGNVFLPLEQVLCLSTESSAVLSSAKTSPTNSNKKWKKPPSSKIDVTWFLTSHCKYHLYLSRLMTSLPAIHHKKLCSTAIVVDEWLQSSLNVEAMRNALMVPSLSGLVDKKLIEASNKTYSSTAKSILSASNGYYSHDSIHCFQVCSLYNYFEGVLHFGRQTFHSHFSLPVMLYYELSQFSQFYNIYSKADTVVRHSPQNSNSHDILSVLDSRILTTIDSMLVKLVEPVVTSHLNRQLNVVGSGIIHVKVVGYSTVDEKMLKDLLNLLWLVLYCHELLLTSNESCGSSSIVNSSDHALLETLHLIERSKKDKNYTLIKDEIITHQKRMKRILAVFMRKLDALMRELFDFIGKRCAVLLSNLDERVLLERSRSASTTSSSSGTSLNNSDISIKNSNHNGNNTKSNSEIASKCEKEIQASISVELANILIQAFGVSFGLAIINRYPVIKSNLTDAFYSSINLK